jgi:hypothetical protein
MSAETKKLYAARLLRRNARNRRPARKRKTLRERRDPRVLKAYQTAAVDIIDALFGKVQATRAPSPALIMAAAALSATKAKP